MVGSATPPLRRGGEARCDSDAPRRQMGPVNSEIRNPHSEIVMIRSSVTVSLVPEARGGPFVFWHDLSAACGKATALGFDAVEIFPPAPDAVPPVILRKLLDDNGLELA